MPVPLGRSIADPDDVEPSRNGNAHRDTDRDAASDAIPVSDADRRSRIHSLHERGARIQRRSPSGMAPRELQPGYRHDVTSQSR